MSVTIRAADAMDIMWLVPALREFDEAFPARRALFGDAARATVQVRQAIRDGPFWVAEVADGYPVGFLYGHVMPHPLCPAVRVLTEVLWWVDPEYRASRAGSALLDEYVAYGKANADWLIIYDRTDETPRPALAKRGFRLMERSYLMETT